MAAAKHKCYAKKIDVDLAAKELKVFLKEVADKPKLKATAANSDGQDQFDPVESDNAPAAAAAAGGGEGDGGLNADVAAGGEGDDPKSGGSDAKETSAGDAKETSTAEEELDMEEAESTEKTEFWYPATLGSKPGSPATAEDAEDLADEYVRAFFLSRALPIPSNVSTAKAAEHKKELEKLKTQEDSAKKPSLWGYVEKKPFSTGSWIWVPQHHRRLWYSERAELHHPMFKNVQAASLVDAAAEQGEAGLLSAVLAKLSAVRKGGFQCNLCGTHVAPTKIVTIDRKSQKNLGETNPAVKYLVDLAGSGKIEPTCEQRIERLCQGYFCHHREYDKTSLYQFQPCFSVCMRCAATTAVRPDQEKALLEEEFQSSFALKPGATGPDDEEMRIAPLGIDPAVFGFSGASGAGGAQGDEKLSPLVRALAPGEHYGAGVAFRRRQGYENGGGESSWDLQVRWRTKDDASHKDRPL